MTASFRPPQRSRTANHTMTDLFACAPFGRVNVVVDDHAEIATAFISTANYYPAADSRRRTARELRAWS